MKEYTRIYKKNKPNKTEKDIMIPYATEDVRDAYNPENKLDISITLDFLFSCVIWCFL